MLPKTVENFQTFGCVEELAVFLSNRENAHMKFGGLKLSLWKKNNFSSHFRLNSAPCIKKDLIFLMFFREMSLSL